MSDKATVSSSAVTLQAVSSEQAGKTETKTDSEVLHPSSISNATGPGPRRSASLIAMEGQPSIAHRRFQTDKAVSETVSETVSAISNSAHYKPCAGINSMLPFHIDLEHPQISVRETCASSLSQIEYTDEKPERRIGWSHRVRHYSWIFFQTSMATGGVASVLNTVPFRFPGLDAIGAIFFTINLFLFFTNCVTISVRFAMHPTAFKLSLVHPTESLFVPCSVSALGTLILNIAQYGLGNTGPWLEQALVVLFWLYVSIVVASSVFTYLVIWSTQAFDIANMTPTWIFPALPFLLVGPLAGCLSNNLPFSSSISSTTASPSDLLLILLGGLICQGIGFLVTLFLYSTFYYRLMTQKLPERSLRPAMFMSAGLSGFTCVAIVSMTSGAALVLPHITTSVNGNDTILVDTNLDTAVAVVCVIAALSVLPIYGLAAWFFLISLGAYWDCFALRHSAKLKFATTWFSFIFPNTPFINATFAIGEAFNADPIRWIGCVLSVLVVGMWVFVFAMMMRAVIRKEILWPHPHEDLAAIKP